MIKKSSNLSYQLFYSFAMIQKYNRNCISSQIMEVFISLMYRLHGMCYKTAIQTKEKTHDLCSGK